MIINHKERIMENNEERMKEKKVVLKVNREELEIIHFALSRLEQEFKRSELRKYPGLSDFLSDQANSIWRLNKIMKNYIENMDVLGKGGKLN